MAAGTHTKFLVGLMLLVNALVLINIRRASPELPRGAPSQYNGGGSGKGSRRDGAAGARRADGEESRPTSSSSAQSGRRIGGGGGGGGETDGILRADHATSASDGSPALAVAGSAIAGAAAGSGFASDGGEGDGKGGQAVHGVEAGRGGAAGEPARAEGGEGEGEGRGAGPEVDVLLVQAERRRKQTEECRDMIQTLRIVPNRSWGRASKPQQQRWEILGCNGLVEAAAAAEKSGAGGDGGLRLPDCTARPSAASDPLIAVCAGSTTRGVPFPDEQSLALFRFLLPSLARTADCGFRYVAVIGYDVGDGFFDGAAGKAKTLSWFESEVSRPATLRGLSIELELVRVENHIKKPGPVFTAITKAAYELGANYIYRVNDDSEMHTPWAASFVNALESMGPPYGVVGPESLNKNILVHDFTHRLHMDIFDKQYYPPSLTDWFVDDWISRVYGNSRTIRAKNCKVEHHTGAHGQRYKEDATKAGSVDGLVTVGSRKISAWAKTHNAEEAAGQILSDKLDGKSAKQAYARNIP